MSDRVYVVADGSHGDLALELTLELVTCFRDHGKRSWVAVYVPALEAEHGARLKERFVRAGAVGAYAADRLEPLGEALEGVAGDAIGLMVGGISLAVVAGGTRLVIRTPPSTLAAAKQINALEASAHVVLGPSRRRFARHFVSAVLGAPGARAL